MWAAFEVMWTPELSRFFMWMGQAPPSHPIRAWRIVKRGMRAFLPLFFLGVAAAPAFAAEPAKPVVAVFNIEVQRAKLSQDAIVALSDYLASQIAETRLFQI